MLDKELELLGWLLREYDWVSGEQTVDQLIEELRKRARKSATQDKIKELYK